MHFMNMGGRECQPLDGPWGLLPDPMGRATRQKWWKSQRLPGEFFPSYDDDAFWPTQVPGAFTRLHERLAYYEGEVVYLLHFDASPPTDGEQCFLHFEGVADRCRVFLNGRWIGEHDGGFVPFTLDATPALAAANRLLVFVDNRRREDTVPGVIHDWWHDGGIHRPVKLVRVPSCHVREASVTTRLRGNEAELEFAAMIHDERRDRSHAVTCSLIDPQTDTAIVTTQLEADSGAWSRARLRLPRDKVRLWAPDDPHLYGFEVTVGDDRWHDLTGLREVRTEGRSILLNGDPIVLRGVCTWNEDPACGIYSLSDASAAEAVDLLKELNCNTARAGHASPTHAFVRACDRAGILVWAEVPAYWKPTMHQPPESRRALGSLEAMVRAFRNNPSVAIWCIGNECLYHDFDSGQSNLGYFLEAADRLHEIDPSRLVTYTSGFEGPGNPRLEVICPKALVDKVDIVSLNSYSGITDGAVEGKPSEFGQHQEKIMAASSFGKPVILGEVGIDAVKGEEGFDYGESRQADYHAKVQELFAKNVAEKRLAGMTPFVLNDFATPIKLGRFQQGYNRKGLVTETLERKKAFFVVRDGYKNISNAYSKCPAGQP